MSAPPCQCPIESSIGTLGGPSVRLGASIHQFAPTSPPCRTPVLSGAIQARLCRRLPAGVRPRRKRWPTVGSGDLHRGQSRFRAWRRVTEVYGGQDLHRLGIRWGDCQSDTSAPLLPDHGPNGLDTKDCFRTGLMEYFEGPRVAARLSLGMRILNWAFTKPSAS